MSFEPADFSREYADERSQSSTKKCLVGRLPRFWPIVIFFLANFSYNQPNLPTAALRLPPNSIVEKTMSSPISQSAPITRREALRRTVVFSATALVAGRSKVLHAAPAETTFAEPGMHLLALGDYGTKGDANQTAVANAMAKFAKSLDQPLEAVLALGDNFYRRITPDRFEKHFEQMYSKDGLDCPFYACAGNHDYGTAKYDEQEGKLQIQLDYAKDNPNSRWKFPSKWYTIELPSAEKPLVKVIVLDGNYWEGGLTPKEKIAQRRFLKAELEKKTDAPFTWLVNHFPLYTDCNQGTRCDDKTLIREWGKLLKNSNVSLCFGGHDHTLQHLRVKDYPCSFIVSGAGGAKLYTVNPETRGYSDGKHLGFNHIHVTRDSFNFQFLNADGECIHRFKRDLSGNTKVLT